MRETSVNLLDANAFPTSYREWRPRVFTKLLVVLLQPPLWAKLFSVRKGLGVAVDGVVLRPDDGLPRYQQGAFKIQLGVLTPFGTSIPVTVVVSRAVLGSVAMMVGYRRRVSLMTA